MGQASCTNIVKVEDLCIPEKDISSLQRPLDPSIAVNIESLSALVCRGDIRAVNERLKNLERSVGKGGVVHEVMRCDHSRGSNGQSALHSAAAQGRGEVLRLLLLTRANLALPDGDGNTPLHLATASGHARAARVLLETGANHRSHNNSGHTSGSNAQGKPFDSAKVSEGKAHIRQMLEGNFVPWETLPPEEAPLQRQSPQPLQLGSVIKVNQPQKAEVAQVTIKQERLPSAMKELKASSTRQEISPSPAKDQPLREQLLKKQEPRKDVRGSCGSGLFNCCHVLQSYLASFRTRK